VKYLIKSYPLSTFDLSVGIARWKAHHDTLKAGPIIEELETEYARRLSLSAVEHKALHAELFEYKTGS